MMTSPFKSQSQAIEEMKQQLAQVTRDSSRARLNVIVPPELFLRPDGTTNYKEKEREVQAIIDAGYPNDLMNDQNLIRAYSSLLAELDSRRYTQHHQEIQEHLERQEEQVQPASTMRDGQHYQYIHSPTYRTKAI